MKKLIFSLVLCSVTLSFSCDKNSQCGDTKTVTPTSPSGDPVLVMINGQPVTEKEFDQQLTGRDKGAILKAKSELYEAKKAVLEEFVFNKLIEAEAKKKNISTEEYMKKEIDSKIKPVSDKDADGFYKTIKLQYEKNGKVPPPLNDAIRGQIKQKLTMDKAMERKEALNKSMLKNSKVVYALEQPRIEVKTGDHPSKGVEKAKVTIVEFSDFQCPFCKKGADTMKEVMKKYSGKIKYFYRDFPLSFHDRAKAGANAGRCASEQGKFWEFHDKLFEDQSKNSESDLIALGKTLKLDMAKYEPCVKEMKKIPDIEKDMQEGENAGVTGTPAYFINGIFLSGALPMAKFEEVINEELKK